MLKKILFIVILIIPNVICAQHIKLDNSILVSSFNNSKDLPILSNNINSYSFALGADYFEKKWFYLSSQIGYINIGGKEENPFLAEEFNHITENKSYVHLNTTFRAYKELSTLRCFLGVGPYLNILAGSKRFETSLYRDLYDLKTYVGGKGEVGLTHDINKFRIGLMASYMLSLTPTASTPFLDLKNNNFAATFSIGYSIRK